MIFDIVKFIMLELKRGYIRFLDQFSFILGLPILFYQCYIEITMGQNMTDYILMAICLLYIMVTYNIIEQFLHLMLHSPLTGPFHLSHMKHHATDPREFNKRHSTIDYFLILYGGIGFGIYPLSCSIFAIHELHICRLIYWSHLVMSVISFWIHDHFHQFQRQSIFDQYKWFQERRSHHNVHHFDSQLNLSIGAIFMPIYLLRRLSTWGNLFPK